MKLKTDFIKVATAGKTIDGREISEKDLVDMAETYDPNEYTATIFFEHMRFFGSYGTVFALKTERDNKKRMCLFAVLSPNKFLIDLNADEQGLFTSIEIVPNFADTGKAYLGGLAVTDDPASLGTEQLRFSNKRGGRAAADGSYFAAPVPFSIKDMVPKSGTESDVDDDAKFAARLKKFFSKFTTNEVDDEESEMPKEQYNAIMAAIAKLGGSVEEMEKKFAALSAGEEETDTDTDTDTDTEKSTETETDKPKGDEGGDYKKIMDEIGKFSTRFEALETKVADAMKDKKFNTQRQEQRKDNNADDDAIA